MNQTRLINSTKKQQPLRLAAGLLMYSFSLLLCGIFTTGNALAQTQELSVLDWMPDVTITTFDTAADNQAEDSQFKILGVGELPLQPLTLSITPPSPVALDSYQELETLAAGFWQPGGNNSFFQNAGLQLGWQLELRQQPTSSLLSGLPGQVSPPLATIRCANGQLTNSSYTASGCRITSIEQQRVSAVADWSPVAGLHTRLGMFRDDQNVSSVPWLLDATAINSALPNVAGGYQFLNDYGATGIQLGVSLQLSAGNLGDLALNADLARVIDYQLSSPIAQQGFSTANLSGNSIASPTDLDIAKLQLDWSRGSFSGGVESIYQETPVLPGISNGNDLTTFNVHFTWRTPWRGSFSVGATNLLDTNLNENNPAIGGDLDSIYGRIPYVRYKQDLE